MLSDITRHRIIPVVVCPDASRANGLAQALIQGGLPLAEVTLRTPAAFETISAMAAGGAITVGAGTVLTPAQVDLAADAGAAFVVSPGFDADTARRALDRGLDVVPGCVTPTEIMAALRFGLTTVKYFPAASYGGAAGIAALSAPFGEVRFIPTGGVSLANLGEYLRQPCVPAVAGSWMVPRDAIDRGDFVRITQLCAEAVATALPFLPESRRLER